MDFATARHNMVESQIKPNRVTDTYIMDALAELPRESFVPKALQGIAYVDDAIDIGEGRYLMEALVLARLLQAGVRAFLIGEHFMKSENIAEAVRGLKGSV